MEYGHDNLVKFPTGFLVLTPVSCFNNIKLLLLKWKEKRNHIFRSQKPSFDFKVWSWLSDLSLTHISGKTICWCQTFYYFFCQARLNLGCVPEEASIIPESDIRVKESWRWTERRLVMDATEVNTPGLSPDQAQSSCDYESRVVSCFTLVPLLTVPHNRNGWIETLFITRRTNWCADIRGQVWRLAKLYSCPCIWCVVLNWDESWAEEGGVQALVTSRGTISYFPQSLAPV